MNTEFYRIEKFEANQGYNAGWEIIEDHIGSLTTAKKRAKKFGADDPNGSYRVMGPHGHKYWDQN